MAFIRFPEVSLIFQYKINKFFIGKNYNHEISQVSAIAQNVSDAHYFVSNIFVYQEHTD